MQEKAAPPFGFAAAALSSELSGYICLFVFVFLSLSLSLDLDLDLPQQFSHLHYLVVFGHAEFALESLTLLLHLKWNRDDGVVADKEGKSAWKGP